MTDPTAVLRVVCELFGVTVAELIGPCRRKRYRAARYAAAWALREIGLTVVEAGELLHRDHTTICYSSKCAATLADRDPAFAARLRALQAAISPAEPAPPTRPPLIITPVLRLWLWAQRNSIVTPMTA